LNSQVQAELTRYGAKAQALQYQVAGESARRTSGLLADATLVKGMTEFAKTYKG